MKILIVDDHQYNRDLLSFILSDDGFECLEACDGKEAYDVFLKNKDINVVLMDINMPVMDGISSTQKIKADFPERFVPVLFVTALDDTEVVTRCLDVGGDDFVPKPVNEDILLAKIKAHVRSQTTYNTLKLVNEKLSYHQKLVDSEYAIVEHMFKSRDQRITTNCDNVVSYTSPASMFDGDLVLTSPSPTGGLYFIVGDFTGHGLSAAIGSLPVTEIFFSSTKKNVSVGRIAQEINVRLTDLLPENMFFCAVIGEVDYLGLTLSVWSGGMNDILCVSPKLLTLSRIESAHMPLGILTNEEFDNRPNVIEFELGTKLYFYTDGINEASNINGEEFGLERLEEIVLRGGNKVVDTLVSSVQEFIEGQEQSDDLSVLELEMGELIHRDKETNEVMSVGKKYHNVASFPWELKMVLTGDDLRATSTVDQIMSFIDSLEGMELHQEKIFTVVNELYSNALEHGVLDLDSSLKSTPDGFDEYYKLRALRLDGVTKDSISIDISYVRGEPNKIVLVFIDSGKGFDITGLNDGVSQGQLRHGRSLALLSTLCSSLEYLDGGNKVRAVYDLVLN